MKNYERYLKQTAEEYDKRTIMSYFCRLPSDRKIFPLLAEIKDKTILEAGLGTGYYTRALIDDNTIVGVDRNPHLCKLPLKVYKGDATELSKLVNGQKFDMVISVWMTEYLNPQQLEDFFAESKSVLKEGGKLLTTVISNYGLGFIYITLAKRLRGINKYNYRKEKVTEKLEKVGFNNIKIINLNSWLYFPWAYLIIAENATA